METLEQGTLAVISQDKNRPFHIRGVHKGQKVIALVDTGASHDFISKHLVAKRRLKTQQEFEAFRVKLANGTLDHCRKMVTQVEIATNRHVIKRNFYVANIQNDIILGMTWINSLGRFIMDGPNLEICFKHEGRDKTLRGMPDGAAKVVSYNNMEKILKHDQGEMIAQYMILDNNTTK